MSKKTYSQLLSSRFKERACLPTLQAVIASTKQNFGPWAQGNTLNICSCCENQFIGHKNSRMCAVCAYAAKGELQGYCNRQACAAIGAIWYNKGTRKHYCTYCARRINECALPDGSVLCTLVENADELYSECMLNFKQVIKSIVNKKKAA